MTYLVIDGISFGSVEILGFDNDLEMFIVRCSDDKEICCHSDELSHAI